MNRGLPPVHGTTFYAGGPDRDILICLGFWEGDKAMAKDVCRLMADLQTDPVGSAAQVMLCYRQDCALDKEMLQILAPKFSVKEFRCTSPFKGWPSGPNGMFGSTMIHVGNTMPHAKCVFWMEADCVPMKKDWFKDLANDWKNRPPKVNIVGHKFSVNGEQSGMHINGVAMYDNQISRIFPEITGCDTVAWDWLWRFKIISMGQHTNSIAYRHQGKDAEPSILDCPAAIVHGFKDQSLINLVRKHRLPK